MLGDTKYRIKTKTTKILLDGRVVSEESFSWKKKLYLITIFKKCQISDFGSQHYILTFLE